MIGSIISGAIGGLAQIGSTIYGAVKSSQLNNTAQQMLANSRASARNWYEQKLDEDYMSRSDVKAALTNQSKLLDEKYKQARGINAVTGGTDESLALQQQAANESLADTTRSIASQAADYKEGLEKDMLATDQNYAAQQISALQNQANSVAQAASQVGQAAQGLTGMIPKKNA